MDPIWIRKGLFCVALVSVLTIGLIVGCSSHNSLTIYSGRSEPLIGPLIQQFSDATGIEVDVKYGKTAQLISTILEEGNNTPADVFLATDPGGLVAIEEMLTTIDGNILSSVPEWARNSEGKWIGLSGRARTVTYNVDNVIESDLPDSLWGFTENKWDGRIGWAPGNSSFQFMINAMTEMWGEDKTSDWIIGIHANNPAVLPNNTSILAAVGSGEIDVGFTNHYYLFRFLNEEGESFRAANYHPRSGGPGSLIMVTSGGILENSSNISKATQFIKFLTSTTAQEFFANNNFEYPLIEGISTHKRLIPLDDIKHPNINQESIADPKAAQELLRDLGVIP